ncbi:Proposed peptidoglycan lipid II flippase MurJ [gamma proteobacterium IMCC2047]|nr:Proposed peptidoglycan lipid II flippase MurJ [gamma proteobacterium IMCC2047]
MELPLGIFGIAIATVILPSLSRQHVSASAEQFRATLDWALRLVCLLAFPAALALFVLAEPLITTLFQYGAMTAQDVEMAAMSLRAYSVGLLAFMLIKVLAPGYYSRQDTKTPVKIGIWAMVANMVMNLILIWPLQHAGLALATSLSAFLNAALLFVGLYRLGVYRPLPGWGLMVLRLVLANTAMVLLILWLGAGSESWAEWTVWQRAWQLAILCVAGGSIYFVMLILSGLRLRHLRH